LALGDFFRLTALLARVAREPSPGPDPRIEELPDQQTGAGVRYDLYRPRYCFRGEARTAMIAAHGVTCRGRRDPRLVHFARCLARSGVIAAVPTLSGLAAHRWDVADLDALEQVVAAVADATAPSGVPLGLIGFSYGGSYALVVAARQRVASRIGFTLTVGAYHSLDRVFDWYVETQHLEPTTEEEWDDAIYLQLILASQHRDRLGLSAERCGELESLLERYCFEAPAGEKRRFYDTHLRGRGLIDLGSAHRDRAVLEALSPAGKLASLRCQVSLIHDERDSIVPSSEAEALMRELESHGGQGHALLVTSLLSHVNLKDAFRLGEVRRLYRALEPVLGQRSRVEPA
jgi:acetyl esterase/lipase